MKRFIIVLLSAAVTAASFAACSQVAPPSEPAAPEAPAAVNTASEDGNVTAPEEEPSSEEPVSAGSSSGKLTETTKTITYMRGENPPTPVKEDTPALQQTLERTGVDLQIISVTASDFGTKMNALYAANDLPDIFGPFTLTKREMVADGALLALDSLIEQHAPEIQAIFEENPELQRTTVNGEIYSLPMIRRDENWEKGSAPMIRIDLLEKNNIAPPATWDELVDVLGQLKVLYPEMVPWGARGTNRVIGLDSLCWITSFGADYNPYLDESGVWQQGYIQPEYKDAVVFMKNMVANGILDDEYVTTEHQTWIEGLSSGKYMFWYDNPTFAAQVNAALSTVDSEARFEPLPILENPYGFVRNYQQPTHYTDNYYFSSETEDPELLIKFMNWAYSDEGMYTFNYGQEGYSYTLDANGQPQWTQEILDLYKDNENAYYAVQSDLGVLNNNFDPSWLNLSVEVFRQSEDGGTGSVDARYVHEFYKDNANIYEKTLQPPLSEEQSARIQEINRDIKDLVDTEINQFIMGLRPIEEYDAFMNEMVSRGAQEIADILTEAENEYQAQIGS